MMTDTPRPFVIRPQSTRDLPVMHLTCYCPFCTRATRDAEGNIVTIETRNRYAAQITCDECWYDGDKRYLVAPEWTGAETLQWVARFQGDRIGSAGTKAEAIALARKAHNARMGS